MVETRRAPLWVKKPSPWPRGCASPPSNRGLFRRPSEQPFALTHAQIIGWIIPSQITTVTCALWNFHRSSSDWRLGETSGFVNALGDSKMSDNYS